MKTIIYILIAIILLVIVVLAMYSMNSRKPVETGLHNGHLRVCPGTPNCVSSEGDKNAEKVLAISYTSEPEQAWNNVKTAITETGGLIQIEQNGYLHAIYITPVIRFVDDVELRMDEDKKVIHIRSASRVGRKDFGANAQRVALIREKFKQ
jgi:uncharacterized protein (DUF1499 family)